jgi:calcineurin-like phosphoesterase family protein
MNAALIQNWNAVVGKLDDVYILGDFLYKGNGTQANEILKQLRGKKYLIRGNHERYLNDPNFNMSAFEWVKDYYVLHYKDARYILFHYPILEWVGYHRKTAHLYGHFHRNNDNDPAISDRITIWNERTFNVGVDLNGFSPVSAETVYAKAFESWEKPGR